jgi:hypothetical protein
LKYPQLPQVLSISPPPYALVLNDDVPSFGSGYPYQLCGFSSAAFSDD